MDANSTAFSLFSAAPQPAAALQVPAAALSFGKHRADDTQSPTNKRFRLIQTAEEIFESKLQRLTQLSSRIEKMLQEDPTKLYTQEGLSLQNSKLELELELLRMEFQKQQVVRDLPQQAPAPAAPNPSFKEELQREKDQNAKLAEELKQAQTKLEAEKAEKDAQAQIARKLEEDLQSKGWSHEAYKVAQEELLKDEQTKSKELADKLGGISNELQQAIQNLDREKSSKQEIADNLKKLQKEFAELEENSKNEKEMDEKRIKSLQKLVPGSSLRPTRKSKKEVEPLTYDELEKLNNNMSEELQEKIKKLESCNAEIEKLKKEASEMQRKMTEMISEGAKLENQYNALRKTKESLENLMSEKESNAKKYVEILEANIASHRALFVQVDAEKTALKQEITGLQDKLKKQAELVANFGNIFQGTESLFKIPQQ